MEYLLADCFSCAAPCIAIYVGYQIFKSTKEKRMEEKKKEEDRLAQLKYEEKRLREEKKERVQVLREEIKLNNDALMQTASSIDADICSFLRKGTVYGSAYSTTYDNMCYLLDKGIKQIQDAIFEMKKSNDLLIQQHTGEDKSSLIYQAETITLPEAIAQVESFKAFSRQVNTLPPSKMMAEKSYGKNDKNYWDAVRRMTRAEAVSYVSTCNQHREHTQLDKMRQIDIEKVLKCVWFFATEKPFSASDFRDARWLFEQIYKRSHVDIIIADLYVKKSVGGEDALREPVRDLLKKQNDSHILTFIASSLMWMNAYQIEHMVLQHMLATGKEMTAKTQERLHSLTNGGGKAPSGFDVKSSSSEFYFDVSALAWRDDEYVGLFENLAFQDKNLTYSLAIRDENKELFIPQGINVPSNDLVLKKFSSVFTEEYGNSVTVRSANCVALSGSGEEKINGILASSGECKQMGVLIHIARIGKKLIIKFYTLFMPTGSDLAVQKQQALSIYKKLSPSVTMWESSLKDTMLMAVEQILNSNVQGGGITNTDLVDEGGNEPIF